MRTALLSVYDKGGIVEFAKGLLALGDWQIMASGGTAAALENAGITVKDVADLVGGGAILGHRVVTLSREVHAGLLAQPTKEDLKELKTLGIPFIDLVCVDLYPLAEEIAKPGATMESVIEKTDIGGPTMLRSAAKGRRIVISRPSQQDKVLSWLKDGEADAKNFLDKLAADAEAVIADYCLGSARYSSGGTYDGFVGKATAQCKYGENAPQAPARLFSVEISDPLTPSKLKLLSGTEPSFNNLAEIDRQLQTITHIAAGFDKNFGKTPLIALGTKHGNPCGAAVGDDPIKVIRKMVMGDPRAIFGGLVMLNFPVDKKVAEELLTYGMKGGHRLLDGISAPAFTRDAIKLMERKGDKCRFLANPALKKLGKNSLDKAARFRYVRGGFLQQPNYTYVLNFDGKDLTCIGQPTQAQKRDIVLTWAICATSNSNTITLAKNGQLIGNGVGQQDRVSCCELAIKRAHDAGHNTKDAVAASDSFFPFPDGPETLAKAGIKTIWATSGSVRDSDTEALCKNKKVTLCWAPDSIARGFFGH
jgi:phosphoribosylaminoimidazolecarboxamide formyltransferase/IMP cyclohydrolase